MRNSKFKFCAEGVSKMAHPSLQLAAALDLVTELGCDVDDESRLTMSPL